LCSWYRNGSRVVYRNKILQGLFGIACVTSQSNQILDRVIKIPCYVVAFTDNQVKTLQHSYHVGGM
jgi:hypothetical protein